MNKFSIKVLLITALLIYAILKYFDLVHSSYLLYLMAVIEAGFFIYLLYRIKKVIATYKSERGNYYFNEDALYAAISKVIGTNMLIRFAFSEILVFFYTILGWMLKKPDTSRGMLFTYHKSTQYGVLIWVILISTIVTTPIFHFLLMQWHVSVAWIVTGLTIYGLIWFYGDYSAIKHKPIVLTKDKMLIRIGIRWKADINLSNIENIKNHMVEEEEKEYTEMTILNEKNVFITLHKPIVAESLFGITKTICKIALYVDKPYEFLEYIAQGYPCHKSS